MDLLIWISNGNSLLDMGIQRSNWQESQLTLWKIGFVVFYLLTYLLNLLSMKELKPTNSYLLTLFCNCFCDRFGKKTN
jgi:hypothetical protein